jgi:hypothetical protein
MRTGVPFFQAAMQLEALPRDIRGRALHLSGDDQDRAHVAGHARDSTPLPTEQTLNFGVGGVTSNGHAGDHLGQKAAVDRGQLKPRLFEARPEIARHVVGEEWLIHAAREILEEHP